MKSFGYDINPEIINYDSSIRDKICIIKVLIETIRFINISKPQYTSKLSDEIDSGKIRLVIFIDKMSRIFISENDKIHSFNFPFLLSIQDEKYALSFNGFQLTNASCSILARVFNEISEEDTVDNILEQYWEISSDFSLTSEENKLYSQLITYFLSFEPGYLRFDHDEKNGDKDYHPVNHIDFNYTNGATFKFGLSKSIEYEKLIDIVNLHTPCAYLKDIT